MKRNRLLSLLALLMTAVTGAWATTPNSIVINGTPQVGDKSISLTYYFDPANVSGLDYGYAPTLKVKCAADNKWDEMWLDFSEVSSGTTNISLENLGEFEAGKTYEVCFAYNNGNWVDEVFQSFVPAVPATGYSITLAEGTEDATNWTISPTKAAEGAEVTATYSGERKVKSVKAVKKAAAPASGTDLATITADYEAKDGETLTGTLGSNVKISIADGATVTLKDVDINGSGTWTSGDYAGITCAGDATITLEGTNTVKGFVDIYPGIFVSSGKTLVINGTGELNASSNTGTGGAGIGGGDQMNCGNIEIQSGTVTAIGNEYGAGIGGGHNANCGDITISGGKVTATGGYRAAGIGGGRRGSSGTKDEYDSGSCGNITISGGTITAKGGEAAAGIGGGRGNTIYYKSSCGTITITSGVTSVTATKGSDDAQSIGAGYLGTCGAVNIENGANVTMGPITVTWNSPSFDGNTYTQDGVTCTPSNGDAASGNCFYDYGDNTFTTTLGKFTKIEIVCTSGDIDGWTKEAAGQYQPDPVAHPDRWKNLYKLTWTGDAESLTIQKDVYGIQSITFNIQ